MEATEEVEAVSGEIVGYEPTEEQLAERTERAHKFEMAIKEALSQGRQAMWALARALYFFNEEQGWEALHYDTQGDWLAQPDVGMSKRQYHRMVRLFRETVVQREIPEESLASLEQSKVEIVLPAIERNMVTVNEALADAESYGVRELREKYIGPQSAASSARGESDASGSDASGNGAPPAKEAVPPWVHPAQVVDSWVEHGGEKRKAGRNWTKFLDNHPLVQACNVISAFFEGSEIDGEVPDKEAVQAAWKKIDKGFRLNLPAE